MKVYNKTKNGMIIVLQKFYWGEATDKFNIFMELPFYPFLKKTESITPTS